MTSSTGGNGGTTPNNPYNAKFNKVLTDDDRRRILKERAKLLAQKEEGRVFSAGELLYVFEFVLVKENYAFDTKYVREVLSAKNVATVPCTPRFITGVLNVRGEIITVLDTKLLFGFDSTGIAATSKIIIVSDGTSQMGFLVDAVVGIAEIGRHDMQPPLSTISAQQARYIAGITNAPLIVIDLDALMHDPGIVVEEEVE
jgi:purine-binding chemotaxis protein CheW